LGGAGGLTYTFGARKAALRQAQGPL